VVAKPTSSSSGLPGHHGHGDLDGDFCSADPLRPPLGISKPGGGRLHR